MEITFEAPVFFSETDEAMFFAWLERVPGFLSVKGQGLCLTVTLSQDRDWAVAELLVLLRRWYVDPAPLRAMEGEHPYPTKLWNHPIHEVVAGIEAP